MNTGESETDMRKILDFIRYGAIMILLLHFYFYCYEAFKMWNLTSRISDNILENIFHTGLFNNFNRSKLIALGLLIISLIGSKGKKKEEIKIRSIVIYCTLGSLFYFESYRLLKLEATTEQIAIAYTLFTSVGFLLILAGGAKASRLLKLKISNDIFNELNETFPQEERLIENESSLNFRAVYNLRGEIRPSCINIPNPYRGLLVIGSPASGKTRFVIEPSIKQFIEKGFALFIYDFKYDDLTRIAYNHLLKCKSAYPVKPSFYAINFDDLSRCHRCNPLEPAMMFDITDATESARTILLGLNREWIKRQGDFWVESAITFLTAVIWFLCKYENGKFCTLPHVIELMQVEYEKLFPVLRSQPEIEVLINPFISAYENDAMEQLEGQVASAKIAMARLSSPQLYYVLSGNDFTLDINNPAEPKIVCMGNNPQKQQIYGAVLSLFITRLIKLVNKKHQQKCSLIFDEFPTIYFNGIDNLLATARSNKVATCLAVQDYSQLKKDYGRDQAEVILNIAGNIICGQISGEVAKSLSERFGKIMQDRETVSINSSDVSISRSKQLESAIPPSKISSLSSGEFVGMVADDASEKIKLKMFHSEIILDQDRIEREAQGCQEIPRVRQASMEQIQDNYMQVKLDVHQIITAEMKHLRSLSKSENDP